MPQQPPPPDDLPRLEIRDLRKTERLAAAGLTARAMRDNPTTYAMFGAEPLDRLAGMQAVWTAFFHRQAPPQLGAFYRGCLVGTAAASPPGHCIGSTFPGDAAKITTGPAPSAGDPAIGDYVRAHYVLHDLAEPHWHVGPVGVEPRFQGRGIGESLMRALIAIMDADGSPSWGETDTEANVRFYRALGWDLDRTVTVSGIDLWFLGRTAPGAEAGAAGRATGGRPQSITSG
ncbi:GNAT family N-acetyltransferase [Amycolatopsis sp. NPDC059090]|uniref:GNAT family N-acetyltransferase n=1 Tax=unclassified Amycolatopsis TaxID=2618356 RepID=UPI00366F2E91